jgi:hypothetical protein
MTKPRPAARAVFPLIARARMDALPGLESGYDRAWCCTRAGKVNGETLTRAKRTQPRAPRLMQVQGFVAQHASRGARAQAGIRCVRSARARITRESRAGAHSLWRRATTESFQATRRWTRRRCRDIPSATAACRSHRRSEKPTAAQCRCRRCCSRRVIRRIHATRAAAVCKETSGGG